MTKKQKLVTCALFYANGPLHLGHLVEAIQADIWVRFQKMCGHDCYFISGSDAHGAPIMLKAESLGITPEQMIQDIQQQHQKDFVDFGVCFDSYESTHSAQNQTLVYDIYQTLQENNCIDKKVIAQAYDSVKKVFLPDRYVKGQCPTCEAEDQYGDNCEKCGATYTPEQLINPLSVLSGTKPITKESEHYFFRLTNYQDMLKSWSRAGHLQSQVANKLQEWFDVGLQDWDISRDAPYFGFEIPDTPGKYFYVWLDAPIGYFNSFKTLCKQKGLNFNQLVDKNSPLELYHFIGKDITYFHALFWPAILSAVELKLPTAIFVHGFLTVNGQKMSKSRGTFIEARTYLKHLHPEYLRYYLASKLNAQVEDVDMNLNDFMQRVNTDLVGKIINIASRCSPFIHRHFDGKLSEQLPKSELLNTLMAQQEIIARCYENRDYVKAVREISALADKANQYISDHKPWELIKQEEQKATVQMICTVALNAFRLLMIYLKPIVPELVEKAEQFLMLEPLSWADTKKLVYNQAIADFSPMLTRIETQQIEALMSNEILTATENSTKIKTAGANFIQFDDFAKVELRIVKIISAEAVPEAEKLLKIIIDVGEQQTRQVFAGIKSAYPEPEQLVGKLTVAATNLEPRKMRFGISEAMILAAGPGGEDLWILHPDMGAQVGMRVK